MATAAKPVPVGPPSVKAKANEKFQSKESMYVVGFVVLGSLMFLNLVVTGIMIMKQPEPPPEEVRTISNAEILANIEMIRNEVKVLQGALSNRELEMIRLRQLVGGVEAQLGFVSTKMSESLPMHGRPQTNSPVKVEEKVETEEKK